MIKQGIITKGVGGLYTVRTEDGYIECTARGRFRKDKIVPTVGDRVEITLPDTPDDEGSIDTILPRTNILIRPPVANVDLAVAVISAKNPAPNLMVTDKLLITLEKCGIETVVAINKTDLDSQEANRIFDIYSKSGYKTVVVSATEKMGLSELHSVLSGRTTVFAGNSGVGKSSLLNTVNREFALDVGQVSTKVQRGKHTTRHVELLELKDGGFVLDTPGFGSIELFDITKDNLKEYYPEFKEYNGTCRFKTCMHLKEPDCSVKQALEDNLIAPERYENYVKLCDELGKIKMYK